MLKKYTNFVLKCVGLERKRILMWKFSYKKKSSKKWDLSEHASTKFLNSDKIIYMVSFKILKLYDLRDKKIPKNQWLMYGIVE